MVDGQRRALVLSGGWSGHQPHEIAGRCRRALEPAGFAVDAVADSLDLLTDAGYLAGLDLIVLLWTMSEISDDQETGLIECVERGVGFAGLHGSADAFRGNPRYQWLIGGQFVAHPDGITDYMVDIADTAHPITEGLGRFAVRSEQYYLHVDPSNHVLATTTFESVSAPWVNETRMPVAWTRRHGEGKVFYFSVGHDPADLDGPEASTMLRRGLVWAARSS